MTLHASFFETLPPSGQPPQFISDTVLSRFSSQNLQEGARELTSLQAQTDALVSQFVSETAKPRALAAMMVGSSAFRLARIGTLALGEGAVAAIPLRVLSYGAGLGSEAVAFEATNRFTAMLAGDPSNPNLWSLRGRGGWAEGVGHSLVTFGLLRSVGAAGQGQNVFFQHLLTDLSMVGGHQLSAAMGLHSRPEGDFATQMMNAEMTNLQWSAGMGLLHAVAPGLAAWERGLDLTLRRQELPTGAFHSDASDFFSPQALPLGPSLGERGGKGESAVPRGPTILMNQMDVVSEGPVNGSTHLNGNETNGAGPVETVEAVSSRPPDLPPILSRLRLEAWGRDARAYQALTELAKNQPEAVLALRDLAFLDQDGAFAALVEVGKHNPHAVEILHDMADAHPANRAFQALQRLAFHNAEAIGALNHLAELGHYGALAAVCELEFSPHLSFEGSSSFSPTPLYLLARAGNPAASSRLVTEASLRPAALRSLFHLAREGHELAFQYFSIRASSNPESVLVLYTLARTGQERARERLAEMEIEDIIQAARVNQTMGARTALRALAWAGNARATEAMRDL